jgi:exonuclease III
MLNVNFNFCNWNIRGLGDHKKCEDVLTELITLKPDAVFLQETKLSHITNQKAKTFLPRSLTQFAYKPADGSAGGIVTATSNSHFDIISQSIGEYSLTTTLKILANNSEIQVTNVYAPTDHSIKQHFLDQLPLLAPRHDTPWLLLGDFNLMRHASEKNTYGFRQSEAQAFNDQINYLSLIELPLLDRRFTWTSCRATPTLERLDHVFINLAWTTMFPNTSLSSLTRYHHVPLIINISSRIPRPAIFRFENSWALFPSARPLIQDAWNSAHLGSNTASNISRANKKCRNAIKSWRDHSSQRILASRTLKQPSPS